MVLSTLMQTVNNGRAEIGSDRIVWIRNKRVLHREVVIMQSYADTIWYGMMDENIRGKHVSVDSRW